MKDYLQYPLTNFWVSGTTEDGLTISLGTFEDTQEQRTVYSLGEGVITNIQTVRRGILLEVTYQGPLKYIVELFPIKADVNIGDKVGRDTVLGYMSDSHLLLKLTQEKELYLRRTKPMNHIYLFEHQRNLRNIPYCNPKRKPIYPFEDKAL